MWVYFAHRSLKIKNLNAKMHEKNYLRCLKWVLPLKIPNFIHKIQKIKTMKIIKYQIGNCRLKNKYGFNEQSMQHNY